MSAIILGIESSCDDTSAAVIKDGYLLSNVVSSQAVRFSFQESIFRYFNLISSTFSCMTRSSYSA